MATARWELELDWRRHVVEVEDGRSGPPRSFRADGGAGSLGGLFGSRTRVAEFRLGAHPATLTLTLLAPGWGTRMQRALRAEFGSGDWIFGIAMGLLMGGHGSSVSGGAAAQSVVGWAIYQLTVDGSPQGSWVLTLEGGVPGRWTFVEPLGSLPTPQSPPEWPDAPVARAPRDARTARSAAASLGAVVLGLMGAFWLLAAATALGPSGPLLAALCVAFGVLHLAGAYVSSRRPASPGPGLLAAGIGLAIFAFALLSERSPLIVAFTASYALVFGLLLVPGRGSRPALALGPGRDQRVRDEGKR